MKIAVDAMGGDNAPQVEIRGAVRALKEYGAEVVLVGDRAVVERELEHLGVSDPRITVHHASEVIGMNEPPAISIRRKRDSSVNVAIGLLRERQVDAMVSAGNTGAVVCGATLHLGLLEGVERPGIAVVFPTIKGSCLLIDAGANVDPKPLHLLQYAIMGALYSAVILHKSTARVGLLNIGEEESKGPDFVRETHELLQQSHLDFLGNIEGRDIFMGEADVIVCDGYIGNVTLKVAESFADAMGRLLRQQLARSGLLTRIGAALSRPAFKAMEREIDYEEHGGAPLLGVDGRCIICHGSSTPKAIKNAIRVASEFTEQHLNQRIVEAVKADGVSTT